MHFPVKVEKTIQAIGVLFRADRVKRMNYMRLLKLLYIADRESLQETGRPITGGAITARERREGCGHLPSDLRELNRH